MKVFSGQDSLPRKFWNSIATIGIFDGIHIGHQAILRKVLVRSHQLKRKSLVITFDPHPAQILTPGHVPPLLMSFQHRLRLLDEIGFSVCWVIHFTHRAANIPAEDFVKNLLINRLHIKELYIGEGFRFGKGNLGDVNLLEFLGKECGFRVHRVKTLQVGKVVSHAGARGTQKISSTWIRRLIERGELSQAARFLGQPVSILGTVIRGSGLGRRLGIPTANLDPHHEAIPPRGVYAVWVRLVGKYYPGVVNIGYRPTIQKNQRRQLIIEVHLRDFSSNLYGQDLEIQFVKKLRNEKKFLSIEALKQQIQKDISKTKQILR